MTINSMDVVTYTAWFILPGFICTEIIYTICPVRKMSDGIRTLKNLGYSIVNLAIWFWLFQFIFEHLSEKVGDWIYLIITILVIATSSVTGLCIGLCRYYELLRQFMKKVFKIQIEKPIPTAWDNIFSAREYGCWVIVSLANGNKIGGRFSTHSHASSDNDYRDIFLEETYEVNENGWKMTPNSEGVWISPNEIKKIEFIGDRNNE